MITRPDPDNNKTTKIVLINLLCSRLHKVLFENHIFYEKVSSIKMIIIIIIILQNTSSGFVFRRGGTFAQVFSVSGFSRSLELVSRL